MKNKLIVPLFLLGQALDFLTTFYVRERFRAREINPLLRRWVAERKWRKLLLLKLVTSIFIIVLAKAIPAVGSRSNKINREADEYNMLKTITCVTWIPVISNSIQIIIKLRKEGGRNVRE